MLEILGWIVVVWLTGSTIYSTQFHLRNYRKSKDKENILAQQMDGPSHIGIMSKKDFLKRVVSLQLHKITILLVLLYFLIE